MPHLHGLLWSLAALTTLSGPAARADACIAGKNDYFEPKLAELLKSPGWQGAGMPSVGCPTATDADPASTVDAISQVADSVTQGEYPSQCLSFSMEKPADRFRTCGIPIGRCRIACVVPRPCISENYRRYVFGSFIRAMSCLSLDPREMAPLYSLESGFHINTISQEPVLRKADVGVGQLSPLGMYSVGGLDLKPYRDKPECSGLDSALKPMAKGRNIVCERVELPGNPLHSFIISGKMYLIQKELLADQLAAWNRAKRGRRYSDPELKELTLELARYAYNGGMAVVGTARLFTALKSSQNLDVEEFRSAFHSFVRAHHYTTVKGWRQLPRERLKEIRETVAAYAPGIRREGETMNRETGRECAL
jgi:hypothetical protein